MDGRNYFIQPLHATPLKDMWYILAHTWIPLALRMKYSIVYNNYIGSPWLIEGRCMGLRVKKLGTCHEKRK